MVEKKDQRPLAAIVGAAIVFTGIAVLTYLVSGPKGYIPEIPNISFPPELSANVISRLEEQTRGFEMTREEEKLVLALESLHLAETDSTAHPPEIERQFNRVKRGLTRYAATSPERFHRLGDLLALRFHSVLMEALAGLSQKKEPDIRVAQFGGAFFERAVESGLISATGNVAAPAAVFAVLFRYRWCVLGDVASETVLTDAEQLVLADFQLRFLAPEQKARRLSGLNTIERRQPRYDSVIARARVLHDAGDTKAALDILQKAHAQGRKDNAVMGFIAAIEEMDRGE